LPVTTAISSLVVVAKAKAKAVAARDQMSQWHLPPYPLTPVSDIWVCKETNTVIDSTLLESRICV
jgi:hypothetical protein